MVADKTSKRRLALALVELSDVAIATSGDYNQCQRFGFSHVLNPRTGKLLQSSLSTVASVSVTSRKCAIADAMATAAITFPTALSAQQWLNERVKPNGFPRGARSSQQPSDDDDHMESNDTEQQQRRRQQQQQPKRAGLLAVVLHYWIYCRGQHTLLSNLASIVNNEDMQQQQQRQRQWLTEADSLKETQQKSNLKALMRASISVIYLISIHDPSRKVADFGVTASSVSICLANDDSNQVNGANETDCTQRRRGRRSSMLSN